MYIQNGVLYSVDKSDIINGALRIPEGVFRVTDGAFNIAKAFYNIKKLVIPATLVEVQDNFFANSKTLKEIEFNEGVQKIGDHAFSGCTELERIIFPNSLKEIGKNAFEKTNISVLTLPKNIEKIDSFAFSGNKSLLEVNLSDAEQLKSLANFTFSDCTSLKKIDFGVNSKIEKIESSVFENTNLQSLSFPKSLKTMHASSVSDLTKLRNLIFNDGFEELVGRLDIAYMKNLKQVKLPNSVKKAAIFDDYNNARDDFKVVIKLENGNEIVKKNLKGKRLVVNSNHKGIKAIYFNKDIELVENGKVFALNDINLLKIENFHRLLGEYKADTAYLWMKELRKHLGGNIKVYPKAEEISVIPVNRMQDYVKNRRIVNEIIKKTSTLTYNTRKSLLTLALSLGILEQDAGIKNEVITLFRENVFNKKYFNSIKSIGIETIKEKENYIYNEKYNNLIKEMFNSKNLNDDLGTLIAEGTNNFDKLIDFKRNPNIETVKGFLNISKYNIENKDEVKIAEVASALNISHDEFKQIAKMYKKGKETKVNNFIDYLLHKTKGEELEKKTINKDIKLVDKQNTKFTFQWLNKDDPRNAFLGYICDSCATVNKVGAPILEASLIQKNVQNLVVKDEFGAIVAKVTAVIDVEEGVILFNTIEANSNFLKKAKPEIREEVANAFKRGIKKMVEVYDSFATELSAPAIEKVNMIIINNKLRNEFLNDDWPSYDKLPYTKANFLGYPIDTLSQVTLYENNKTKNKNSLQSGEISL